MNLEKTIYRKLKEVNIIEVLKKDYLKIENPPFMPLVIEKLYKDDGKVIIAMTHYYEQNGDLVPDPDMEIEVDVENEKARALSFQNSLVYQHVNSYPKIQDSLNEFLIDWLNNIKILGYDIKKYLI